MSALTRRLLGDIARRLGWRAAFLVIVMVTNGLTDGVGLALLIPLLTNLANGSAALSGTLGQFAAAILDLFGWQHDFAHLLVLALAAFIVQGVAAIAEGWLSARYRSRYVVSWRTDIFAGMMQARWRFFLSRKAGELNNTLLEETQNLGSAFYLVALIIAGAIFIAVYLALALFAAWPVALGATAFGAVMAILVHPLARYAQKAGGDLNRSNEALHGIAAEFLSGAKLIKATASEDQATRIFGTLLRRVQGLQNVTNFQPFLVRSVYEISAILALGASLWVGIIMLRLSPTLILVTTFLFVRIYLRLAQLQQYLHMLHSSYAPALDPAQITLRVAAAEAETGMAEPDRPFPGNGPVGIVLRDLGLGYDGHAVLTNVSLQIPAGTVLGIAGASGAGKSTLVDAVLGLVEPQEGHIEIDGLRFREFGMRSWRRAIGYVAQDTFLFNASIRDNIRWSSPAASDADVERAARQAHAAHFIEMLPQGFDTEVGDRGVRLSGGERQRIGLARALIGRVRLLVLDEATSALDSESELAVLQAIAELKGTVTIIMIAHRLSTLRTADTLVFLENGRIAERGTWDELVRGDTRFREMWRLQTEDSAALLPPSEN